MMFQWLATRSNQLIANMVNTVADTTRQVNREICQKFDQIVEKVTAVKTTTKDLVAQQEYCEQLRIRDLVILSVSTDLLKLHTDHEKLWIWITDRSWIGRSWHVEKMAWFGRLLFQDLNFFHYTSFENRKVTSVNISKMK